MTLTRSHAPLSGKPPETVNYEIEGPAHRLLLEDFPRRVRAELAGATVLDTTRAALLHETGLLPQLYIPEEHVRSDLLTPTDHHTTCPFKGEASYWSVRVGDRVAENAVWAYPRPIDGARWLRGRLAFYWHKMDRWLDEDEPVEGHIRDPYTRVDVRSTSRHVEVRIAGVKVADTQRANLLSETSLPNRFYIPTDDVRLDLLSHSDKRTICPYKGTASYWSARVDGRTVDDVAWTYQEPFAEVGRIAGQLSFLGDEVETLVDGEPLSALRGGADGRAGPGSRAAARPILSDQMATVEGTTVADVTAAARAASRLLARADSGTRNRALRGMADALERRAAEVLDANARDLDRAAAADIGAALIDRLTLTGQRVAAIASDVRAIASLPDPVGETIEGHRLENGLDVRKVRVPIGVVAVVYEARPNVTIDCSALCLKSGNAIVLRGSSMAAESNAALAAIARDAVAAAGLPPASVSIVAGGDREELRQLATDSDNVDLIIPRGGEGLKAALKSCATVPVIYAAAGNCHLFVDASADLDAATAIAVNAKVQRPGVCNSIETLLVHADAAPSFLPRVLPELRERGVELRVDARARTLAGELASSLQDATDDDWATEFLALVLAVKVVDTVEEAIEHVNRHGSGHSEAVATGSVETAQAFAAGVDAACVYVNASTRFTDGGVFGMGAEIGNSTQKLHARGPIGVRELCTYKYIVQGSGQVRA